MEELTNSPHVSLTKFKNLFVLRGVLAYHRIFGMNYSFIVILFIDLQAFKSSLIK